MTSARDIDIVVYGATGFVGKLTAEYLARHAPADVTVGLGGRSQEKLEAMRAELGDAASSWPLVVADAADPAALAELAGRARVVATTVGPYRKYGMPLVEACTGAGTDYVDLTGEVMFMRDAIDRFQAGAEGSGARIVHTCGFDSIPSDLGVLLLHEAAAADGAGGLEDTTYVVTRMRGRMSGGTIDSARVMVDEMRTDPTLAAVADDPYALSPDRDAEPDLGPEADLARPVRDDELGLWLAPFPMAGINTRVVRRSNALQGWAYGRGLRYRETMAGGAGLRGRARATAIAGGTAALMGGLGHRASRAVLDRLLPDPGEGPSAKQRAKGFFDVDIHTRTSSGRRYVCHASARGDPGYAATSAMLGESALCLALDRDRLPDRAGFLTPATAMGSVLVDRLRKAGQTYEVETVG